MLWPPFWWVLLHLMLSDLRLTAVFSPPGNPGLRLPHSVFAAAMHVSFTCVAPQSVDSLHPRWVERPVNRGSCNCHPPALLPRGHLHSGTGDVLCFVQQDRGKATEAELQKRYGSDDVIFRQCDVTDSKQLEVRVVSPQGPTHVAVRALYHAHPLSAPFKYSSSLRATNVMALQGKGVFLTGGARGIGRGMTEALLSKGCRVLFCDVLVEAGKATEAELQKKYGADNAIFRQCDVTDAEQLKETFQAAVTQFGAVDICVNNAGILHEGMLDKVIDVNVTGLIRGSQLALEHMRRDRGGRGGVIVNVSSIGGLAPFYYFPIYIATKHAIVGYTTSWAKNPRNSEMGVKWRVICPHSVKTDILNLTDDQVVDLTDLRKHIQKLKEDKIMIEASVFAEAFIQMMEDHDNDGVIFDVKTNEGRYRRRQIVDADGVSNPFMCD
ncbi:hypothetical protein BaRGS_00034634 [Batillaria attramentaria]|uniref:15-hydroxyprostaglandin dehydrogenase [NAD(+)] n=1 Tax=Batillaria attramentaria TaxID=370345 RepID=A0ABD0JHC6_9CAEN